ncbi:hypothetical protein B0T25DRAFT_521762 [Lasiosphaeria hispida]|uniref:Tetraspanin Tsp3 n=1 Tax=Lasiosphaeria hispida TaxID=260671 RepID=A0AAJ0M9J8_9PEZI|nr:hypothetical protein B0T25DRAFT_521762 [Lasiosphaeria hispida]
MQKSWVIPGLYILMVLALTSVAIYTHVKTKTLSLPISPLLTVLPIFLPTLSLLTTLPRLTSTLFPWALQAAQLVLTTILSTLLLSPVPLCILETKWRSFWTSHDAQSIRAIQDALDCCGFRSVKDMAWPFPSKEGGDDVVACAARFGRSEACSGPWEAALRGEMGGLAGVVLVVGVLQVVALLAARMSGHSRGGAWGFLGRVFAAEGGRPGREGRRRPLLGAVGDVEEEVEGGHRAGGNVAVIGEEAGGAFRREEDGRRVAGYGGTGHRVEAVRHQENDPWADAREE